MHESVLNSSRNSDKTSRTSEAVCALWVGIFAQAFQGLPFELSGLARTHPTMYRKDQLRFNPSGVSGTGMTSLDAGGAHEVARGISSISRIKSSTGTGDCGSRCNSEHKIEGMNRGLAVSDVSSGWCLRFGPLISRDWLFPQLRSLYM